MVQARNKSAKIAFYLLICIGLIAYFSYHAIHGRHGLEAKTQLEVRIKSLESELNALKTERQRLERDTAHMTSGPGRDDDLIEEQARAVLNFANPNDIVLVKPQAGTK